MKVCPRCGRTFDDAAVQCGYCETDVIAADVATDKTLSDGELSAKRKRDWLTILVGLPAFILFIYLVYRLVFSA